jgi:TPR repeat protein
MVLLWYRSSAEQGFPAAMRNLGRAFNVAWVSRRTQRPHYPGSIKRPDDQETQYKLGMIYYKGLITPQNTQGAIKWFKNLLLKIIKMPWLNSEVCICREKDFKKTLQKPQITFP